VTNNYNTPPVDVVHLLPVLDRKLMELLSSLTPDNWQQPTVAKLWTVKDVVAHLLDGNIRTLSLLRDRYVGKQVNIQSPQILADGGTSFAGRENGYWIKRNCLPLQAR